MLLPATRHGSLAHRRFAPPRLSVTAHGLF